MTIVVGMSWLSSMTHHPRNRGGIVAIGFEWDQAAFDEAYADALVSATDALEEVIPQTYGHRRF